MAQAFHRSIAVFNILSAIAQSTMSPMMKSMEAAKVQYKSRGKGGKKAHVTNHKHMAYVRAQRKKVKAKV